MAKHDTNVDPNSLEQALSRRSVDVPDDFFLEDLFRGEAPPPQTLTEWIGSLKSLKSGNGDEPVPDIPEVPEERHLATTVPVVEVPEPNAQNLQKTHPSVKSKETESLGAPPKLKAKLPEPAKTTPKKKAESAASPPANDVLAPGER